MDVNSEAIFAKLKAIIYKRLGGVFFNLRNICFNLSALRYLRNADQLLSGECN